MRRPERSTRVGYKGFTIYSLGYDRRIREYLWRIKDVKTGDYEVWAFPSVNGCVEAINSGEVDMALEMKRMEEQLA